MAAPSPGPREVLACSPEAGHRATASRSGRHNLLWRLRDKQSRLGLFEIGPGHELHRLTCMMQAGLWDAIQATMDHPPTGLSSHEDFSEVLTQVHEGFELGTLAGPAFARLRSSLGLAEEDYQAALGPEGPYLQFLGTSRSKANFFLSHDQRFFLKTQRRREMRVLLAHLPRYVQHLQRHPHSLLSRLLGMHSLRVAQGRKKYFIVMQSIFYPTSRIAERYDIKGCEVNRWVEPDTKDSSLVLVLKDLNFQGKTINLGLCRGRSSRRSQKARIAGCCQMSPTPSMSSTGPSNAISSASWTSPRSTGSASGWNTCGRRCATRAGPSLPSARLTTPVASASGWRRTPSDLSPATLTPSGPWEHAVGLSSPPSLLMAGRGQRPLAQ